MQTLYRIIFCLAISLLPASQALAAPNNLTITVENSLVQFHLVDPAGLITGYDPAQNTKIDRIPNIIYAYDSEAAGHRITRDEDYYGFEVKPGKYRLKIFGSNFLEKYSLNLDLGFYGYSTPVSVFNNNVIYPGVTWVYEFNVPEYLPDRNENITFTKVSSPDDLIRDVIIAGDLKYIGKRELVTDIVRKISLAKIISGDKTKEYRAILAEINRKYKKPTGNEFIKDEAYNIIKADIEYIIGH